MDAQKLDHLRHSAAHMLAAAVMELYPGTKLAIGPTVENGFYYDFKFPEGISVSDTDLPKIEEKMKQIIKGKHHFVGKSVTVDEAKQFEKDQPFKLELIEEFSGEGKNLTLYESGPFTDLCRGGHAENTSEIPADALKLEKVAGAYWRGNEKNPMLTRIYGLLFGAKQELKDYLTMMEEAKKRDHRKLGPELDLFTYSELVGSGLPLFTPKGTIVRRELEDYIAELRLKKKFERVWIPHIAKNDLYKTSGHWDKFEDDLFHVRSKKTDTQFVLKPMNCPHHTQIFASRGRSYREMPVRYFETTTIYRDENTGQLQGLTRVRSITQDDSHVFCRRDQIKQEVGIAYEIISTLYKTIGMELKIRLSTHDPAKMEKYLGTPEIWEQAENNLASIIKEAGKDYSVGVGEAAFYGPKLDFMGVDSLGREWQLATIQLDMNQPERFKLSFTNAEGVDERPVMIHVAVLGSVERFMGVLIEHTAGNLPVWLSPVQVMLAAVSEKHVEGVQKLAEEFDAVGIRVAIDDADESIGKKVRNAAKQKIPYIVVVGDRELEGGEWTIRVRGQEEQIKMTKADFVAKVVEERSKRL